MTSSALLFFGFVLTLPPEQQRERLEAAFRKAHPEQPVPAPSIELLSLLGLLLPAYLHANRVIQPFALLVPPSESCFLAHGRLLGVAMDVIRSPAGQAAKINRLPAFAPRPAVDTKRHLAALGLPSSDVSWWMLAEAAETPTIA